MIRKISDDSMKKMRDMLGEDYKNLNNDDTMYEFLKSFDAHQIPKKKIAITKLVFFAVLVFENIQAKEIIASR